MMTPTASFPLQAVPLPDDTQLPAEDETTVAESFADPPQAQLLSSALEPILHRLHPDGKYCLGQNHFIYFEVTSPLTRGARAPDWFYIPNVSPMIKGRLRRSYVMWYETVRPTIVIEF